MRYTQLPTRSLRKALARAVGTPAARMTSLAKDLLDSIRAAAFVGPKIGSE